MYSEPMITVFLGHPIPYWRELQRWAEEHDKEGMIIELAKLRAKVVGYEKMIDTANEFRGTANRMHT